MVGNPYRWRATIPQLENRNSTAGCLLAILFIVPYLARDGIMDTACLTLLVIVYVVFVVPLITGIMPKKQLIAFIRYCIVKIFETEMWTFMLQQIFFVLYWIHSIYLQLDSIHTTVMQVVFNIVAEKLICPEQTFCSLYVLFFFSVLAYLQRALQARPWAHLLNETSTKEFIKLTTAFIIARLGKGVAMSMILLTLTLQFDHMEPRFSFVSLTFIYFCITQYHNHPTVRTVLFALVSRMHFQCLEGMEELWVPVLTSSAVVLMASLTVMLCILNSNCYALLAVACYVNILVPATCMIKEDWTPLSIERASIGRFPIAKWKNSEIRSGGRCAVCLDKLHFLSSRVTPCGHVFHGSCLRVCLRYSSRCPLCKFQL